MRCVRLVVERARFDAFVVQPADQGMVVPFEPNRVTRTQHDPIRRASAGPFPRDRGARRAEASRRPAWAPASPE